MRGEVEASWLAARLGREGWLGWEGNVFSWFVLGQGLETDMERVVAGR